MGPANVVVTPLRAQQARWSLEVRSSEAEVRIDTSRLLPSLSSTELHFLHRIQWAWVLFEVHCLERRFGEGSEGTLGETGVRELSVDAALVESTVWVLEISFHIAVTYLSYNWLF